MHVNIVGAGIGGLALAAALDHHGIACSVFEQSAALRAAGYAITIQTNALAALRHIGLEEAVRAAGHALPYANITTPQGRVLVAGNVDLCAIRRSVLLEVLAAAAPHATIHFNRRLEPASAAADSHADWIIAADGVHSAFREGVAPGESAPRDAHCVAWRALSPAGSVPLSADENTTALELWGRGRRFGIVPLPGGEIYWFAVTRAGLHSAASPGAVISFLSQRFKNYKLPVAKLIAATPADTLLQTPLADVPPISKWHAGRVLLLGDAAHPMTPNLGQGGCQAIEDAVVLAHMLAQCRDGHLADDDVGPRYQAARKPRADVFVEQSFAVGRLANIGNPLLVALRNGAFRLMPQALHERRMKPLLTFPPLPS